MEGEGICVDDQKPPHLSPCEGFEEKQDLGQCGDPCYFVNWQDREMPVALAIESLFFLTIPAFKNYICSLS